MIRELYSNEPNTLVYPIASDIAVTDFEATLRVGNDKANLSVSVALTVDEDPDDQFNVIVSNDVLAGYRYARIDIEYKLGAHGTIHDQIEYRITKRYLRFADMRALLTGEYELTEQEFDFIERNIRYEIDAYCNQHFDGWYGTRSIKSLPGYIGLPEHMEYVEYVTLGSNPILNNYPSTNQRGFKLTDHGFAIINEERVRVTDLYGERHGRKAYYTIRGQWGYSSVPATVQQAAAVLFKSNMCDDIEYRNKYIKSIRNENIRIELRDEAFDGHTTGNAFADDILLPYVVIAIGAI